MRREEKERRREGSREGGLCLREMNVVKGETAWHSDLIGFVERSNVVSLKLESQWEPGVV